MKGLEIVTYVIIPGAMILMVLIYILFNIRLLRLSFDFDISLKGYSNIKDKIIKRISGDDFFIKKFSMILAIDDNNGFGKNNTLPWRIKEDMAFFSKKTQKTKDPTKINAVVMGRKTWNSIPDKFRPLPNRINCILTKQNIQNGNNEFYFNSLGSCLDELNKNKSVERIFIIGGAKLYNQVLDNTLLDKIYLTKIEGDYNCDVFFDGVPDNFKLTSESEEKEEKGIKFKFLVYQ